MVRSKRANLYFTAALVLLAIMFIRVMYENDTSSKKECLDIIEPMLQQLKDDNGIVEISTTDNVYTMWYNSKGEGYAVDDNTYYIFRNDGKMVYYGVSQDENGDIQSGSEIIEQVDFVSQVINELDRAVGIEINTVRDAGEYGTAVTEITYSVGDEDRLIEVRNTGDNFGIDYCLIEDNTQYTIWSFDGYTIGNDWELPESMYADSDISEEALLELVDYMDDKAQSLMSNICPTMGITVEQYYYSDNPEDIYIQLLTDLEFTGYSVSLGVDFYDEINDEICDLMLEEGSAIIAENSIFDFALQFGLENNYII